MPLIQNYGQFMTQNSCEKLTIVTQFSYCPLFLFHIQNASKQRNNNNQNILQDQI